jgi:hypothetical protein
LLPARKNVLEKWEAGRSAVGFATVADGGDRDGVLVFETEEHAVVAAAKPVSGGLSFFTSPVRSVK